MGVSILPRFLLTSVLVRASRESSLFHTLQQNGVAKRKNGAIIGDVRAMIHD